MGDLPKTDAQWWARRVWWILLVLVAVLVLGAMLGRMIVTGEG
jgi:hypothetical protein